MNNYLDERRQQVGAPNQNVDEFKRGSVPVNAAPSSSSAPEKQSFEQIYAGMTREQFDIARDRAFPLENMASDMLLDPERNAQIRNHSLGIATDSVNNAFDRSDSRLSTMRSRTNQSVSSRQRKNDARLDSIGRSTAMVGARNSARQLNDEREMELIGG